MKGTVFNFRGEDHSACHTEEYGICVDEKVHLRFNHVDAHCGGDDDVCEDVFEVTGPCDGSCRPQEVDLVPEMEKLVKEFLETRRRGAVIKSGTTTRSICFGKDSSATVAMV